MRQIGVLALALALAACADRSYTPTVPSALDIGTNFTVFAASSREPEGNGNFGFRRSEEVRFLELTVSIPPGHEPGKLDFGYANPDPRKQFTMAGRREFSDLATFRARLGEAIRAHPERDGEVALFVHGFNATQAETAFRAAQLANDIDLPGTQMIYSWPSKGKALAYAYDGDSALFARDGLERTLREIKAAGSGRIVLVAHSMGSLVTMETLRQIDIRDPGWAARNLGGVILISPDLDIEVFRSQMKSLSQVPQPFVVFVSEKDKVLNISSRLRGTYNPQRLGNISNINRIQDLPVTVINTTAFSKTAGSAHFIPATSPALLQMVNSAQRMNDTFGPDASPIEALLAGVDTGVSSAQELVLRPTTDGPR